MWVQIFLVVLVAMASVPVKGSQTVMKDMTKNFLKVYDMCQKEYNLPESTATDMMNFWKEGHQISDRNAGCAILCLSSKMDLLDPEGKLHRGKIVEFAKEHGSDDATAHKMVDILHECDAASAPREDQCMRALEIAMCFKTEIHKLNWAPDPELLLEELVAELN